MEFVFRYLNTGSGVINTIVFQVFLRGCLIKLKKDEKILERAWEQIGKGRRKHLNARKYWFSIHILFGVYAVLKLMQKWWVWFDSKSLKVDEHINFLLFCFHNKKRPFQSFIIEKRTKQIRASFICRTILFSTKDSEENFPKGINFRAISSSGSFWREISTFWNY